MQCTLRLMFLATTMALLMVRVGELRAELITLDFDSPGTGSEILKSPLVISEGTITASNVDTFTTVMGTGNSLEYREPNRGFATLEFDFDVRKITLIYTGNERGVFTALVRDVHDEEIDSFFNPDTNGQTVWGPITLAAEGIRKLEFADAPDGHQLAAIDNVKISLVPEPANLFLFGLGVLWMTTGRRIRWRGHAG